jgi:DNA mismatch repair protein MutS
MSIEKEKFTPAMQQYVNMKKQYADCILFFRLGDFYEIFFEDAKICSKVLDLVLTSKNKNSDNPIPMAGIPYHSADKYVHKLVSHGYKVAIAEQMTDPVPGKIVDRQVQSVITPGTYIQESQKNFAYTCAIYHQIQPDGYHYHLAWGDFSLGDYQTKSFVSMDDLQKILLMLRPVECIVDPEFPYTEDIKIRLQQYTKCLLSVYDVPVNPDLYIQDHCRVQTVASFGKALEFWRLYAFALLIHYLQYTQKSIMVRIVRVALHSHEKDVLLDEVTMKNLEIFSSSYEHSEKYSLVWILDNTYTNGGARLLRHIISHPVHDMSVLAQRQQHIQYCIQHNDLHAMHQLLRQVHDIPKMVSTILYKQLTPLSFVKLRSTLAIFLDERDNTKLLREVIVLLQRIGLDEKTLDGVRNLYNYLDQLIVDAASISYDNHFIRDGYSEDIDALKKVAFHSDELLLAYQQELVQYTGAIGLKMRFVKNQGYYIEVTNKDIEKLEQVVQSIKTQVQDDSWITSSQTPRNDENSGEKFDFQRRQTLKGVQRYSTPYLDTLQEKILSAKDELTKQEYIFLAKAQDKIAWLQTILHDFAACIAWLDVYVSHAIFVQTKNWVKPEFVPNKTIDIVAGRHPVIDAYLPIDQQFIPNDLYMGIPKIAMSSGLGRTPCNDEEVGAGIVHIITGPNMGGKSTFLRQNALIVLLAHCGLRVPAKRAQISLVDGIFARVGSGDVIAKNQSTFMTEMIEVANILHNATANSFVIFDELGRGTSTYDGLALTQAILFYVVQTIKCKTLIATHYHELIALEKQLAGVYNYSVSVYETDKEVVFLKKIVKGWANKSYGIDVAKIAGIPESVIAQAKYILDHLEDTVQSTKAHVQNIWLLQQPIIEKDPKYEKVKNILHSYDLNNITPLQALQILAKLQDEM